MDKMQTCGKQGRFCLVDKMQTYGTQGRLLVEDKTKRYSSGTQEGGALLRSHVRWAEGTHYHAWP